MNTPDIDNKLVQEKFRIEMRSSQPGDSGEKLLYWYYSTVTDIVNKNKRSENIKWDGGCLHDSDMKCSTNVFLISRWNQRIPAEGSCREYSSS